MDEPGCIYRSDGTVVGTDYESKYCAGETVFWCAIVGCEWWCLSERTTKLYEVLAISVPHFIQLREIQSKIKSWGGMLGQKNC